MGPKSSKRATIEMGESTLLGRLVAVALLIAVGASIYYFAALPLWRSYQQTNEDIAQTQAQIARYRAIASQRDTLHLQLSQLQTEVDENPHLLAENNVNFAAAALQEQVKTIVRNSGGALNTTQVLPTREQGPFNRVTINVRMFLSTASLQTVLHQLESSSPYLIVDDLTVLVRRVRKSTASSGQSQKHIGNLDVRMSLSGFIGKEAS